MAELKTRENAASVTTFLARISHRLRGFSLALCPHKNFSSLGNTPWYSARSENSLCEQTADRSYPRIGEISGLATVADSRKRADCKAIGRMMRAATGKRPKMWGSSIVGYDRYDCTCASGHSGSWPIVGYSPRVQNIAIYIMPGFTPFEAHMKKPGRYKTARSCLYIKRLADVDDAVLGELIEASVAEMRRRYGG